MLNRLSIFVAALVILLTPLAASAGITGFSGEIHGTGIVNAATVKVECA